MRSLSIRVVLAFALALVPMYAFAANVTISGTTTFAAIDGSVDDEDHVANGVFTVTGNLTVNGTISCNDDGAGANSACPMQFMVGGNLVLNAGSAIFAENRTKAGNGGDITFTVGGNVIIHGPSGSLAGAIVSSAKTNDGNPAHGGDITFNGGGTFTQESGSTVSSAAQNSSAGAISITSGGQVTLGGYILAGPSRTISTSTIYTGSVMTGGGSQVVGGAITIKALTHNEPGLVVNGSAIIASQSGDIPSGGSVTLEGCNVQINGLVASLGRKNPDQRVTVRSGTAITVDGSQLNGTGSLHLGRIRSDSTAEDASTNRVELFAAKDIVIVGPSSASIFTVTSNPGDKGDAGSINVISVAGTVTASGNAFAATGSNKDQTGGNVNVSAKGNVTLNGASIIAAGGTSGSHRGGGHIAARSYSGALNWIAGVGDVRPVGSTAGVPVAQQGTISLTYCTTLSTSGTSFPTNGSPVGVFPTTAQTCSPSAPSLPSGTLPTCNTPPVANNTNATTLEDHAVTVTMTASDADGNPLTFSIVTGPAHGSLSAIFNATPTSAQVTYTPDANYNGSDSFTFKADDGQGGTSTGTVSITITPVNDPPTFNLGANPVTSLEDAGPQTLAGYASSISAGPTADEASQTVTFTVTNDNNALFSVQPAISSSGTLTYTSAPNANGSANITVVAHDNGGTANGGNDTSAAQNFNIFVTAVNDAPSFTKGADQTVNEEAGAQSVANWATAISAGPADESGQTVTFAVTNDNNALFSGQPAVASNGTLTYTPAANANGIATVTVVAHDDGGTANGGVDTSAAQMFTITVTAVNDAPSFTSGGDVTVLEDSGAYSQPWATAISAGPANESSQSVTFTSSNDNNALFSAQPSVAPDGTLTFTSLANANGTATVTVTAHDDGGTANGGVDTSAAQTFTITVTAVNDAPSFTKGGDVTVNEDSGAYSQTNWATAISPGPNESSQTVSFNVSNSNNALFSAQPTVDASGTLTFTPAPNANGTATVTIAAHDDGGTANGGVDTSAAQTFTITVNAVNDAPSFTGGGNVTVLEDSGAYSQAWATAISAGPPDEASQSVTFTTSNSNNALFSVQPSVDASGNLTFTVAPDAFGTATVSVTAHDDGGTANGGVDTSAAQTFILTITAVNDAPSFTKGPDVSASSDAGAQSYVNWATSISAGPANESAQTVSFLVSNDNNAAFTAQPSVTSSGTLNFTPATSAPTTIVHVSVAAHDNGGTANGGVDTSAAQTFDINITHANQPPVAGNDAYDAVGNTELAVGTAGAQGATLAASGSLLANDSDPDGDPIVAAFGSASAGANVTVNANGTFTYLPPAGFTGDDTFTYMLSDDHGHTVMATVTIHVTKRVLYVKNDGSGSTGRVDSPFDTLAAAQAASADNDIVYVFTGDGTTNGQSAGFTLAHNGERLIGEGVALTVTGTYNGSTNPQLRAAGTAPQIFNAGGVAVTVAKVGTLATAEVSGINVTGAGSHGVQITDATNVTMDRDSISAVAGSCVKGTKVVNFSLTNSTISGAGASGVAFDDAVTLTENNLSGNVTIANNNISTPTQHGIDINNFNGTITSINVTGNSVISATTTALSTGSGIRILANGSATTVAKVVSGSITNNTVQNFPSGGGIIVQGSSAVGGPATQMGTPGSGTDVITITGNSVSGLSAVVRMATQAINALVNRSGVGNFVISGNGTLAAPLANVAGSGIAVSAFGNTNVTAAVTNNFLAPHNTAGNGGVVVGVDQVTAATDTPVLNATITGNNITFVDGNGILATARNTNGTLQVKIQNNIVAPPLSGVRPGIRVDSGNGLGNALVCLNISGNTSAGSGGSLGIGLRKQGTLPGTNAFGVNGMAATSSPGVETYVNGLNPSGGGTVLLSATSGFTNCSLP
jgi:hypothetical protein